VPGAAAAGAAGITAAAVGFGAGFGAAAAAGFDVAGGVGAMAGVAACAAGGAAAAGAGGGTAADGGGDAAGAGMIALTAVLQELDSLARFRFRHSNASLPPGVTPEQFAMKSERQDERIALVWSGVGCCARTPSAVKSRTSVPMARQAPADRDEIPMKSPLITWFCQNAVTMRLLIVQCCLTAFVELAGS
jgi:hypothetical protein